MGMNIILLCCFLVASPFRITGMPQPAPQGTTNITSPSDSMASESNVNPSIVQQAPLSDDSDMYMEPQEPNEPQEAQTTQVEQQTELFKPSEPEGGSQNFYPSFLNYNNQPLGHSRPFYYPQQEAAYSQRPSAAYRHQQLAYDNTIKYNNPFRRENYQTAAAAENSAALLGSGNFGVIRGGTFYNENDEKNDFSGRYNNYSPFFQNNNGHGRPSFYFGATNPRPTQHEQFANFRDFADINTPNPAYSEYVVVYINKNGSAVEEYPKKIAAPKNIIERLAMLDLESKKSVKEEDVPPKKLSLSKRKLALLTPEKKYKVKKTTTTTLAPTSSDLYEPLLALS